MGKKSRHKIQNTPVLLKRGVRKMGAGQYTTLKSRLIMATRGSCQRGEPNHTLVDARRYVVYMCFSLFLVGWVGGWVGDLPEYRVARKTYFTAVVVAEWWPTSRNHCDHEQGGLLSKKKGKKPKTILRSLRLAPPAFRSSLFRRRLSIVKNSSCGLVPALVPHTGRGEAEEESTRGYPTTAVVNRESL